MTSAPWSAMTSVRNGPGRKWERSRTRRPSSFIRRRALFTGLSDEGIIVRPERRTHRLFETLSIDLDRICQRTQARFGWVWHVPGHLRLGKEWIVEGLRDIQNRRDRQYAVELIEPVAGRLFSNFAIQNRCQIVTVGV